MIATITHTRRPLWVRLVRPFMVWMLRSWIADEEAYADELRRGGLYTDDQIATRLANLSDVRARLILWERR